MNVLAIVSQVRLGEHQQCAGTGVECQRLPPPLPMKDLMPCPAAPPGVRAGTGRSKTDGVATHHEVPDLSDDPCRRHWPCRLLPSCLPPGCR